MTRVWFRALFIVGCLVLLGITAGIGIALAEPAWLTALITFLIEGGFVVSVLRDPLIRKQLR